MAVNAQVTDYIQAAPDEQRKIMEELRTLITQCVPQVSESIKWGRPIFTASKDFAYLKTAKAYVTLGFFESEKLEDPEQRLEGTGKSMRHIKLKKTSDIDAKRFSQWFETLAR